MDEVGLYKALNVVLLGIIGYFLKRLHTQVEGSASKIDLEALQKRVDDAAHKSDLLPLIAKVEATVSKVDFESTVRNLRLEHEADRRELRENQVKLFDKLDLQQQLLTQVATQVAMLLENRRQADGKR